MIQIVTPIAFLDTQLSLGNMKITDESSWNKPVDFKFRIFTRSTRYMRVPALNNTMLFI